MSCCTFHSFTAVGGSPDLVIDAAQVGKEGQRKGQGQGQADRPGVDTPPTRTQGRPIGGQCRGGKGATCCRYTRTLLV